MELYPKLWTKKIWPWHVQLRQARYKQVTFIVLLPGDSSPGTIHINRPKGVDLTGLLGDIKEDWRSGGRKSPSGVHGWRPGRGSSPSRVRGGAPVEGLGDKVPQKLKLLL